MDSTLVHANFGSLHTTLFHRIFVAHTLNKIKSDARSTVDTYAMLRDAIAEVSYTYLTKIR
jgi:hypothetical protein